MIKRYRSPTAIKKRRKRLFIQGGIVIGAISLVLGGLSYISRLETFQIQSIKVKGVSSLSEEQITTIFNNQIAGTYAFLFPKKNIFIYPKDKIEEEINTTYKQIEDLQVEFAGTHTINIEIKERVPFAIWCGSPEVTSECYFFDRKGYVYSRAPHFSGITYTKYYGNIEGDPLGADFLPEKKIQDFTLLIEELKKQQLEVVGIEIENKGEYIAHLKDGGKLLFNDEEDFSVLINNIATVFAKDGIKKEDIIKLDYLNLRFDKKVFFKLKE